MYGLWIIIFIIILSSIPAIAVFIWFRLAKYQFSTLRFLFALLAGAAAVFPALLLQSFLPVSISAGTKLELFYNSFIRIATVEEICRLLLMLVFFLITSLVSKSEKAEFLGSSVSYFTVKKASATGLVAGLGFALIETATILITANIEFGIFLIMRIILAALIHAACSCRIGAAAVMIRSNPILAVSRIIIAITIHAIYNLMILVPVFQSLLGVLIALAAFISSILTIRGGWTQSELAMSNEQ